MTWSKHSRRIDPISCSAKPFCQGEDGAIGSAVYRRDPVDVARHDYSEPADFGAAAVGAAAAGAYGYNNYNGCYRDTYGYLVCLNQYLY
jgi:hypothetical protein